MLHVSFVCTPCCMLLGVVALSLKPVKLLAKCKQTQRLPTFLGVVGHATMLRPFARGLTNDATTTRTSTKTWICVLSVLKAIIPTNLLVKCRRTLLTLNSKGPYQSSEREIKLRRCLFTLPRKREWAILQLCAWCPSLWVNVRLRSTLFWYKLPSFSNGNFA